MDMAKATLVEGSMGQEASSLQQNKMEAYYRFQSKIYDLTRWSFLFGRAGLIAKLPVLPAGAVVLEIGCGTGFNLIRLARKYPKANIYGIDTSSDMLNIAKEKLKKHQHVNFLHGAYGTETVRIHEKPDLIVFSYALSMINPQYAELVQRAYQDLKPGGIIAVADFNYSPLAWFRKHMSNHHVRMEKHLLPVLDELFTSVLTHAKPAYLGIWQYLLYIGKK